jgi:hypothetical protein
MGNIGQVLGHGGGLGGYVGGTTRHAPAEDVIEAVERLNRALQAAKRAGWDATVNVGEQAPTFAGEGGLVPVVSLNLQKQV